MVTDDVWLQVEVIEIYRSFLSTKATKEPSDFLLLMCSLYTRGQLEGIHDKLVDTIGGLERPTAHTITIASATPQTESTVTATLGEEGAPTHQ